MRSQSRLFAMLLDSVGARFAQGQPPPPTPTETTTPDIPGSSPPAHAFSWWPKGSAGRKARSRCRTAAFVHGADRQRHHKVDAQGNRTSFLEKTNGANGVTFDSKGRLIATQPATKEIAILTPTRTVLASRFEGQPLTGPNDLIVDKKGGVYFTDPGPNPGPGVRSLALRRSSISGRTAK